MDILHLLGDPGTKPALPLTSGGWLVAAADAPSSAPTTAPHPDDALTVDAPAAVIAAFLAHVGRDIDLQFRWDEEAHLWCLSTEKDGTYHESDDKEADNETEAALLALRDILIDQQLMIDQEVR